MVNIAEILLKNSELNINAGSLDEAKESLKQASQIFLAESNYEKYLTCVKYQIRIIAEQMKFSEFDDLSDELNLVLVKKGISLNSAIYYSFGVIKFYKNDHNGAEEQFKMALNMALIEKNAYEICSAYIGLFNIAMIKNNYDLAVDYYLKVENYLPDVKDPDLIVSIFVLKARLLMKENKYDLALENLIKGYQETNPSIKVSTRITFLISIIKCHLKLGHLERAQDYLTFLKSIAHYKHHKFLLEELTSQINMQRSKSHPQVDLTLDSKTRTVFEKDHGVIDFKNQYLLLDILKLFLENQGKPVSKETIVNKIWNEEYNSEIHDNKIYVTLKRLKSLIEPNPESPKYIYRSKNGYFINESVNVSILS